MDDLKENWILTGFHYTGTDKEKNREATEAIKTVIAKYSNSDGYSYFRNQVGAAIASLDSNITKNDNKRLEVLCLSLSAEHVQERGRDFQGWQLLKQGENQAEKKRI